MAGEGVRFVTALRKAGSVTQGPCSCDALRLSCWLGPVGYLKAECSGEGRGEARFKGLGHIAGAEEPGLRRGSVGFGHEKLDFQSLLHQGLSGIALSKSLVLRKTSLAVPIFHLSWFHRT